MGRILLRLIGMPLEESIFGEAWKGGDGGGRGPYFSSPPAFINRLEQGSTILKLIQNLLRLLSWARSFHLLIFSCWGRCTKS